MKTNRIIVLQFSLFFVFSFFYQVQAKVVMPSVFSDNMVFQQKTNAAIWGKTDPGKTVQVIPSWNKKNYSSKADQNGNWKVLIPTPSYGGPYAIDISDGSKTTLSNVLIGEVWVCSGQSNMEMPLSGWGKIENYEKEIADAQYPNIRLLQAEHVTSNLPLEDVKVANGGWKACSPQTVAGFSSVAYFFAREIYKRKGIPIGLIHTSWGGTIAEAWTSAETLNQMPDFADAVTRIQNATADKDGLKYKREMEEWLSLTIKRDPGYNGGVPVWAAATLDASSWKNIVLPAYWEKSVLPGFDGAVWFRKNVVIPQSWAGKDLKINLGTIDDDDVAYFNGEKIGETKGFNIQRIYTVPADKVKAGISVLTVRAFDTGGDGGIYGDKNILSVVNSSGESVSLNGDWQYHAGVNLDDVKPLPISNEGPNRPTVLYNAMINPFIPFAIKGAIWYQGESNADRAHQYRTLFPAMITDWRKNWNQGDFPFYFVQLANFMKANEQPEVSAWAELRDAQLKTLSLPNTGMAVAIDIGDAEDIHPKNKQEVGRRLALIALANAYGDKVSFSGPLFQSQKKEGNGIILSFKYTNGGLKTKDGEELNGFSIAGTDKIFYSAKAKIQGDQIVVTSAEVANPVAVRYAWANNPVCNLYNGAGLPASPFRTDEWADSTFGKK